LLCGSTIAVRCENNLHVSNLLLITIYHYVKVQQMDHNCETGDKKQTRRQNSSIADLEIGLLGFSVNCLNRKETAVEEESHCTY
jgi:hypothetical protein